MTANMDQSSENKPEKSSIWDLLRFAIIVAIIIIPFRIFVAQPYIVEGSSMDPTFKDGDYLIVDQLSYRFSSPSRGDVIIMRYPKDATKFFIKRVIGLPGETLVIKEGKVFLKNSQAMLVPLDESYVEFEKKEDMEVRLKNGEYFVMGDNRAGSSDSRVWGPLPASDLVGEPILRLLPISKLDFVPGGIK